MPLTHEQEHAAAALRARMVESIEAGHDPIGRLFPDDHELLTQLHIADPAQSAGILVALRDHARSLNWPVHRVNHISFRAYVESARNYGRIVREARTTSNVARIEEARSARARANGTRRPTVLTNAPVSEYVASESPRLSAIGTVMQHFEGRLWFDEFHNRMISDWDGSENAERIAAHDVSDTMMARITTWLQERDQIKFGRVTERQVSAWISYIAHLTIKNEPRDWLTNLPAWDGAPRLSVVLSEGFGCAVTDFNREAGRCWFVSMVARIMEPGCKVDTMPVLIGGQGIFKSQALEIIGGKWYAAASSGIDSKDFLQELQGVWLYEVQEMHSLIATRHGAAKVKAVLSTRQDRFRLPYATLPQTYPRTVVIVGTTNQRGDWHSDDTGGRRFWPFHVGDNLSLDWLRDNRDQLFAEALDCYRAGTDTERGKWWNVPQAEQRVLMEGETEQDSWHDAIATRLEHERGLYRDPMVDRPTAWDGTMSDVTEWGNILTNARIAYQWLRLPAEAAAKRINTNRIARIMRTLGWSSIRQRIDAMDYRPWVWVKPGTSTIGTETPPPDDPDDIPF